MPAHKPSAGYSKAQNPTPPSALSRTAQARAIAAEKAAAEAELEPELTPTEREAAALRELELDSLDSLEPGTDPTDSPDRPTPGQKKQAVRKKTEKVQNQGVLKGSTKKKKPKPKPEEVLKPVVPTGTQLRARVLRQDRAQPAALPTHLRADGISHAYGARKVLTNLSIIVDSQQRLGLIGENGVGKSTLMRILAGVEEADAGTVRRPRRTGMLFQEVPFRASDTINDVLESGLVDLRAIERELEAAARGIEVAAGADAVAPTEAATDRYTRALAAAEAEEVWTVESRRDEVLTGLGVGGIPLDRRLDEISGGQRSRFALAALLLGRPSALLLDEPTNHLDDQASAYLREQLLRWRGVVVFASHDRAFLDEVATTLIDIDASRDGMTRFGGGYSAYLSEKATERARWQTQYTAEQEELKQLENSADVSAREIQNDNGRRDNDKMGFDFRAGKVQQQLARRVRNAQERYDRLERHQVREPTAVLSFGGIPTGSHPLDDTEPLITVADAHVESRLTLSGLTVEAGSRLLVTGSNGSGKSTLLAVLAGSLDLDGGTITRRADLRVALLEQDVRFPDPSVSARLIYERTIGQARADAVPLVSLGLIAEADLDRGVGELSTGQQRRLALALIIARPPHLFLLDEPTNHLSLSLATELEDALGTYPGAVVVASHDRWLRQRWAGQTVALDRD